MKGENPLVTLIIPFSHADKALRKTVDSILDQTYSNIEILLIGYDLKSQDAEDEWELLRTDCRIQVISDYQNSFSKALNVGCELSKGSFIAFLDQGNLFHPQKIEKQVSFFNENPETEVVSCLIELQHPGSFPLELYQWVEWCNHIITSGETQLFRFIKPPFIFSTLLFRQELLHQHGLFYDGDFPEEYELFLRWMNVGVKMEKITERLFILSNPSGNLYRVGKRYNLKNSGLLKSMYLYRWLIQNEHPYIWVWGSKKKIRERTQQLEKMGILVEGYIGSKNRETDEYFCISSDNFNWDVAYIKDQQAYCEIKSFFSRKGKTEGVDYIMIS